MTRTNSSRSLAVPSAMHWLRLGPSQRPAHVALHGPPPPDGTFTPGCWRSQDAGPRPATRPEASGRFANARAHRQCPTRLRPLHRLVVPPARPRSVPRHGPRSVDDGFPDETIEGAGPLADIRARLDDLLDLESSRMAGLDEGELAARAKWSGVWVDCGFRMGRWSSHLREHTIQIDKTLVMLAWTPREVDRLVGLVVGAYGRLEAEVFGLRAAALDRAGSAGRTPAAHHRRGQRTSDQGIPRRPSERQPFGTANNHSRDTSTPVAEPPDAA